MVHARITLILGDKRVCRVCGFLSRLVPYPHFTLIASSHRIKLWEESGTDEAIGTQQRYEQIGDWSTATRGGGWVAKDDCLGGVQDKKTTFQAEQPNFIPQTAPSIIDAINTLITGECENMFCNEIDNREL